MQRIVFVLLLPLALSTASCGKIVKTLLKSGDEAASAAARHADEAAGAARHADEAAGAASDGMGSAGKVATEVATEGAEAAMGGDEK